MKKKLVSFVLVLAMLLSLVPASVFASDTTSTDPAKDIKVYLTIIDKGNIALSSVTSGSIKMVDVPVIVSDANGDGKITYDEALLAAHYTYNDANGYVGGDAGWVTKFWNIDSSNIMFYVNNALGSVGVNQLEIKRGDNLTVAIMKGYDAYLHFDEDSVVISSDDVLSLKLIDGTDLAGASWTDLDLSTYFSTAEIYVDDTKVATSTDIGKFTIDKSYFTSLGEHYVTAKLSTNTDIIMPVCKVTVVDSIPFTAKTTDTDTNFRIIRLEKDGYETPIYDSTYAITGYDHKDLYTIETEDKSEVKLDFGKNTLTYNYALNNEYLNYGDTNYPTGQAIHTRKIDCNNNNVVDYIQVQDDYVTGGGQLRYAITFKSTLPNMGKAEQYIRNTQVVTATDLLLNYANKIASITTPGSWDIISLSVYKQLGFGDKLTPAQKQTYVDTAIATINKSTAKEGEVAVAIIGLSSLGYDVTKLYPVNSNDPINAIEKLNNLGYSGNIYNAPYMLIAYAQGDYGQIAKTKAETIIADVISKQAIGWWGDGDTTGPILSALALYKDVNGVNEAINKAIEAVKANMSDDGRLGNLYGGRTSLSSNSTALVIAGLVANGVDPYTVCHTPAGVVTPSDLVTGLLTYAHYDTTRNQYDGFGWNNNASVNDWENQGFRGYAAAYYAHSQNSFATKNILDFSSIQKVPARANNKAETNVIPAPSSSDNIVVKVTIKGKSSYIINDYSVTVPADASAAYAFNEACVNKGISISNGTGNYISSVNGLSEFDEGPNSGWLYKINGTLPNYGVAQCSLKNGDSLLLYYTVDWTQDPDAGGMFNSDKKTDKKDEKIYTESPFKDVDINEWYGQSIAKAYDLKIVEGDDKGMFNPKSSFTRGMLVTMLFNLESQPATSSKAPFVDINSSDWYAKAVNWAYENKIVGGKDSTHFAPNVTISREEMATMLYNYAKFKKLPTEKSNDLTGFTDNKKISSWALGALKWANAYQIMEGSNNMLKPSSTAVRAEAVTLVVNFLEKVK